MPIYIPDNSNVMQQVSQLYVTTSDNVTREIREAWYTGVDNVNNLVYQNKLYLMENGQLNIKAVPKYSSWVYGVDPEIEKRDDGIFVQGYRGSASGSYPGFSYFYFYNTRPIDKEYEKECLFNLVKNRKKIYFDVDITCTINGDGCYAWVGFNPDGSGPMGRGVQQSGRFSGVLQINIAGMTIDELMATSDGMPLGAGAYSSRRGEYARMLVKNIWLE